jgi:hypothetical protein
MLARWLQAPAGREVVLERQVAARELAPRLELREELSLLGESTAGRMAPERLRRWGEAPVRPQGLFARIVPPLLAALALASLLGWIFLATGPLPFVTVVVLEVVCARALRARVAPVLREVEAPTRELALFSQLLERIECESVDAPRLRALRAELETDGMTPSARVAQLRRLVDLADARRNQFFAPIAGLLMWGTQIALAIERWRAQCGPQLRRWLEAAAEFEALCSLAGHSYLNPSDPFPEIVPNGPIFDGKALGHPLLPRERCVRNDLALGLEHRGYVMSGSNMSGKSTMLRTVGVNAVLALAGAPVRADSLRISPLLIGASLQVRDSLQAGISHFYAELVRLREIVGLAENADGPGLLFLLDEVLHGTNSHDRGIGAEALLRGLVVRGAIGIATTHDLALARIADELAPQLVNVHFADRVENGEMLFDYELKPGVVRGSNALELMRSVGLEV